MIYDDGNSLYFKYVNGSHTPPSDRNRKNDKILTNDTTKWTFSEVLSSHLQGTPRSPRSPKDKQNTIKLLHSAWFNDTWLNYMDSTMTVTMVHLSRAPSHRNRHVKHRRERVPPESICRLHSGTGGDFPFNLSACSIQFNFPAVQSTGKKTKHRQDGQSYSLAPCDAMWFQSADFFYAILF